MIELRALVPEDGTWLGLNLVATQLTAACADRKGGLARRAGCERYVKLVCTYSIFGHMKKWDAFLLAYQADSDQINTQALLRFKRPPRTPHQSNRDTDTRRLLDKMYKGIARF